MQQSNVVPITSARSVTPPTRKISAREAATDIKSGMSDFILMEKYTLSTKGLQSLFQKLVDAGLVSKSDLSNRIAAGGRFCCARHRQVPILWYASIRVI